jgi:hypothetical protein
LDEGDAAVSSYALMMMMVLRHRVEGRAVGLKPVGHVIVSGGESDEALIEQEPEG